MLVESATAAWVRVVAKGGGGSPGVREGGTEGGKGKLMYIYMCIHFQEQGVNGAGGGRGGELRQWAKEGLGEQGRVHNKHVAHSSGVVKVNNQTHREAEGGAR